MVERIRASDVGAKETLTALLDARLESQSDVSDVVKEIVSAVRAHGDAALKEYTERFDDLALKSLRFSDEEIAAAQDACPAEVKDALTLAAQRIRSYHEKQLPSDLLYTDDTGTQLGWQWRAVDAAGLYVPGGRASYPSSVLMNAIPAQVAGAQRLVMCVPTPGGEVNPALLVAATLSGVLEIYRVGGAQAIAAMAYGCESIAPVDVIVGPGNAYVAEAKQQVFGRVGIDTIAGPSEICVVADAKNNPEWIAADLLSQAEHDPQAQSILICDDADFAASVEAAIETTLESLEREAIARASWEKQGVIVLVEDAADCAHWINLIAPEHLELAVENPKALAEQVKHAGAIFMGRYTPEAIGDYMAGPSHVLPTTRAARYSSGLSVYNFLKKSSLIGCTQDSLQAIAREADALAQSEGLGAHGLSVRLRSED